MTHDVTQGRRGFLARLGGAVAAFAAVPAALSAAPADHSPATRRGAPDEPWLARLTGKHRQLFHTFEARDGRALEEAKAYLDIHASAYATPASDVNVVVAAHGYMLGMVLGDALWQKYLLGAFGKFTDPRSSQPATRNIYLVEGDGELLGAGLSVPSLMRRGVTFLACNNALTQLSHFASAQAGAPQPDVHRELVAGLVPGTVLVPAMVIAIGRAQERGCAYIYCG